MTRRTTTILVLAAVLLTAFSVALSRRDSRDWRANRSRRILPFPWQDAASVTLTRPGRDKVELFKDKDGQWKIRLHNAIADNLADNLNPDAAESLAALATLAWREPLPDRAPPETDKADILTVVSATGQKTDIAVGDVRNNLRAAVIDNNQSAVYGINQDLLDFLDWPAQRFRSMLLAAPGGGLKPDRILLSPAPRRDPDLDIVLEQQPGKGWRLDKPVAWPADENRLDIVIRWLDRLRAEAIAAEMSGDLEYFGFTEDSPRIEARYPSPTGAIVRRVEFGGDAGDGKIYAREVGRAPIFTMPKAAMAEISLDVAEKHPDSWRNFYRQRNLDRVGPEVPESVVVEQLLPTPAKLTITHLPAASGSRWQGVLEDDHGSRTFAVDPPDGRNQMQPLTALFTGLANLRVKNFLEDGAPGHDTVRYTAFPAWRYSIRLHDGRALPGLTLYAADAKGALPSGTPYVEGKPDAQNLAPEEWQPANAGIAFSVPDREAVMETFGELSYLLCLPPYRYQSRRQIDSDPKKWSRVEIIQAAPNDKTPARAVYTRNTGEVNEQWWLDGERPEPLMDGNNRFVSMLLELSQLRSDGFVQDISGDVANFGLDQPEITAIVYSSLERTGSGKADGPLFTLFLGGQADAEGRRYARLNDGGPVFLTTPSIAEALGETYR